MTTFTAPAFTIGQRITFSSGHVVTVVDVEPPPLPTIYLRNPDGNVWQTTPGDLIRRITQ